ncbi:MAG: TRAP transporter small permease subunit [Deltaproteobacteria bacterium]|nr:MAG: TRAP transporter small permease subunit [Deltaproteobacteria bacterium]
MLDAVTRFARAVDALSTRVGTAAAWLYPVLVVVLIVNVLLRYGFGRGSIELEELQWHLFSAAFLLGYAYAYVADAHVRVDVLHARLSRRTRIWIELFGALLFLFPWSAILSYYAFDFFWRSWRLAERSSMPSGLPARYVIKFVLFAALALLALQALAVAARSALELRRGREP